MTDQTSSAAAKAFIPRSLFMFSVIYGGMVCIAGVLGNKQVALGPLAVEAGIFPFLLLVILSSSVAALHGKTVADRLVQYGFIPLIGSILLTLLVLALPASPKMDGKYLDAFNTMMGQTPRIWVAGIVAYGTSQLLNVYLFDRLKNSVGKYVALRGAIAAVLSQIVDTLLFVTIAFYGIFPITELMLGQMLAKVVLSLVMVPLLISFFVGLGHRLDGTEPTA
jgi:queuosine precursor transporter